jgi:hypothetical protein
MNHGPECTIPNKARLMVLNLYIVAPAIIGQPDANGYSPLEHGLVRLMVRKYDQHNLNGRLASSTMHRFACFIRSGNSVLHYDACGIFQDALVNLGGNGKKH